MSSPRPGKGPVRKPARRGKVITFYSFKGGTGRTQVLANTAFLLASAGHRVCAIDWDLEAPGLHRYFHPFLADPEMSACDGLVDYLWALSAAALTPEVDGSAGAEVDILDYVVGVDWDFDDDGDLDFIAAGRQGPAYATRTTSFQWEPFYTRLGGGRSLNAARERLTAEYDFVLIDSRTGISDTSGICTIQLPDILVACYTLNRQSIEGVSDVLTTVVSSRREKPLQIYPLEMRVEINEKQKLEAARRMARPIFDRFRTDRREGYWDDMEVTYWPFYAFEEVLAAFGDDPSVTSGSSMIKAMARVTSALTGVAVSAPTIERGARLEVLAGYALGTAAAEAEDPVDVALWDEVASRFRLWQMRQGERHLSGVLSRGNGLLPEATLRKIDQRGALPDRFRRDLDFMEYYTKSRDWPHKRSVALVGIGLWALLASAAVAYVLTFYGSVPVATIIGVGLALLTALVLFAVPVGSTRPTVETAAPSVS